MKRKNVSFIFVFLKFSKGFDWWFGDVVVRSAVRSKKRCRWFWVYSTVSFRFLPSWPKGGRGSPFCKGEGFSFFVRGSGEKEKKKRRRRRRRRRRRKKRKKKKKKRNKKKNDTLLNNRGERFEEAGLSGFLLLLLLLLLIPFPRIIQGPSFSSPKDFFYFLFFFTQVM